LQLTSAIRPQEIYDLLNKIGGAATTVETRATASVHGDSCSANAKLEKQIKPVVISLPAEDHDHSTSVKSEEEIKSAVTAILTMTDKSNSNSQTATKSGWLAKNFPKQLPPERLRALASNIVDKLGRPQAMVETANKKFSTLFALVDNISGPDKRKLANAVTEAEASFKAVAPNFQNEVAELEKWFNASQDRAQQWFQMHTRIFTIICGVILAFVLQLDTREILKFVSTNAATRSALAVSADKLVEKADGILEKKAAFSIASMTLSRRRCRI